MSNTEDVVDISVPVAPADEMVANDHTETKVVKKSAQIVEAPAHTETDGSEDEEEDDYNIDQDEGD